MSFWQKLQKPFLILAPMEDVTDTVFRRIIFECGRPDVFFTEFTSTDGLCSPGREKVSKRLIYTENERPLVAQIWGNNPNKFYESSKILVELGFDGIDINLGCPVSKIVKTGTCSALIENPDLVSELITACKEAAPDLPLSVKTRLGFKKRVTESWANFLLDQNLAAITFHARTAKELSKVPADWSEINKIVSIKEQLKSNTLIIGNGDVQSYQDAQNKAVASGADGIMIGRGVFNNPFIFNKLLPDNYFNLLSKENKLQIMLKHARLHTETWGKNKPYKILKKFFKIYISGFEGASELRTKIMETNNFDEALEIISQQCQ